MTRRRKQQTYGERMASWEHEQDQRIWMHQMETALAFLDLKQVEELVKDGLTFGYSFDNFREEPYVKCFMEK